MIHVLVVVGKNTKSVVGNNLQHQIVINKTLHFCVGFIFFEKLTEDIKQYVLTDGVNGGRVLLIYYNPC
ncbi:MAG: hypothetical protein ACJAX4_001804 [Clostridium sp.]|jgi:hypothetical protein